MKKEIIDALGEMAARSAGAATSCPYGSSIGHLFFEDSAWLISAMNEISGTLPA